MIELDVWIEQTLAWIEQDTSVTAKSALTPRDKAVLAEQLRAENAVIPAFEAPKEPNWPLELLRRLPAALDQLFQEHRDIVETAKRTDLVIHNLNIWLQQFLQQVRRAEDFDAAMLRRTADEIVEHAAAIYLIVREFHGFHAETYLLQLILTMPTERATTRWIELMCDAPPSNFRSAAASVDTLVHRKDVDAASLFPALLPALDNPTTIAAILDLSNWSVHQHKIAAHPLAEIADKLNSLLDAVVERLRELETNPRRFGNDVAAIQHVLDESVALCVSLCDALGLMKFQSALSTIRAAVELKHRRITCEAAAAMLQLGDTDGKELLIRMAAEPIARLRVLNYAEEFGFLNEIKQEDRDEAAIAEAQLCLWLASPSNYGIAPKQLELLHSQSMLWPSYSDPQLCYLFRFDYPLVDGQYSNVGIAGPLVHAFSADMAELPIPDIYAAFAGWQAEHNEIFEIKPSEFTESNLHKSEELKTELATQDFVEPEIHRLGNFFGEWIFIGQATHEESEGTVVYDGGELLWYPQSGRARPIDPEIAYCIYKGRRLLRSFNS